MSTSHDIPALIERFLEGDCPRETLLEAREGADTGSQQAIDEALSLEASLSGFFGQIPFPGEGAASVLLALDAEDAAAAVSEPPHAAPQPLPGPGSELRAPVTGAADEAASTSATPAHEPAATAPHSQGGAAPGAITPWARILSAAAALLVTTTLVFVGVSSLSKYSGPNSAGEVAIVSERRSAPTVASRPEGTAATTETTTTRSDETRMGKAGSMAKGGPLLTAGRGLGEAGTEAAGIENAAAPLTAQRSRAGAIQSPPPPAAPSVDAPDESPMPQIVAAPGMRQQEKALPGAEAEAFDEMAEARRSVERDGFAPSKASFGQKKRAEEQTSDLARTPSAGSQTGTVHADALAAPGQPVINEMAEQAAAEAVADAAERIREEAEVERVAREAHRLAEVEAEVEAGVEAAAAAQQQAKLKDDQLARIEAA
ncbi:MAG: hypothetical protein ACYTFT_12500, partial [Planctomycetota bacterium]